MPLCPSTPTQVKSSDELLRCDRAEGLFAYDHDLFPVDFAVKTNSEPATSPDIRWPEESVGLRRDEFILDVRWSRTPQVRELVIVVAIEPQHKELPTGKERWCAVAQALRHARQTHADRPDSPFGARLGHQADTKCGWPRR